MAKTDPAKKPIEGCTVTFLPDGRCRVLVDITVQPTEVLPLVSAMGLVNVSITPTSQFKS